MMSHGNLRILSIEVPRIEAYLTKSTSSKIMIFLLNHMMIKEIFKPTQILSGTNDIDLDIFAQKQKELA